MKVTCAKVELLRQNRKAGVTPFAMNKITQEMRFRQAVIEYSLKYGVTKAAIRYKTNRQYFYRWRKRYDGTLQSLVDRSHRPHNHPKQHTESELKLISDMRRRNPNTGLVIFWWSCVNAATAALFRACIGFCGVPDKVWWSSRIPSTSQNHTSKCNIPASDAR